MHMHENKDNKFWEGHKNVTKSSNFFDSNKYQVISNKIGRLLSNFMAFSQYLYPPKSALGT